MKRLPFLLVLAVTLIGAMPLPAAAVTPGSAPEPTSLILLGAGLAGFAHHTWQKRRP